MFKSRKLKKIIKKLPPFKPIEFTLEELKTIDSWRKTDLWKKIMVHLDYQLIMLLLGGWTPEKRAAYLTFKAEINNIAHPPEEEVEEEDASTISYYKY